QVCRRVPARWPSLAPGHQPKPARGPPLGHPRRWSDRWRPIAGTSMALGRHLWAIDGPVEGRQARYRGPGGARISEIWQITQSLRGMPRTVERPDREPAGCATRPWTWAPQEHDNPGNPPRALRR